MVIFWTCAKDRSVVLASGLVGGTILSHLGLRGFDLSVQLIVQEVSPCLLQASSLLSHLYLPEPM